MTYLTELVELFEYKVADIARGQAPRGDRRDFMELRATLLGSQHLDGRLRRRLMAAEKTFRDLKRQGLADPKERAEDLLAQTSLRARQMRGGELALPELGRLLWEAEQRRWVFGRLWASRNEPSLMTLRVLSAMNDTVIREQKGERPSDLMTLPEALTAGLSSPQQVEALSQSLTALMAAPAGRARLRSALRSLLDQPLSVESTDDSDLLLDTAHRRAPETGQAHDLAAVAGILERLIDRWPERPPLPARLPMLFGSGEGGVMQPDDAEPYLFIDLAAGQQARWKGTDFSWTLAGQTWQLLVGGRPYLLRADIPANLRVWTLEHGGWMFYAVLSDHYLLLRSQRAAPQELRVLASKARGVAYLLSPQQHFANLRLARAGALALRGQPVDAVALGPALAAHYQVTAPQDLGALGRRGIEALDALMAPYSPEEGTEVLAEAAQALGLEREQGVRLATVLRSIQRPDLVFDPQMLELDGLPPAGIFVLLPWKGSASSCRSASTSCCWNRVGQATPTRRPSRWRSTVIIRCR
ncbi:hypothetical protein ACFP81_03120 [Deinococcus lacus]|uniref:Uncharacterized protein n=1 Tax=Deinococcus lacus TaxID=392561 RepID=A0ABW1Y9Z2_9DEIO